MLVEGRMERDVVTLVNVRETVVVIGEKVGVDVGAMTIA